MELALFQTKPKINHTNYYTKGISIVTLVLTK